MPWTQPIANELTWLGALNAQVRSIKSIVEGARPQVSGFVSNLINVPFDRKFSADEIRHWREEVDARVADEAGFAHEGYARLKLSSVCGFVARMITICGGEPVNSPLARLTEEIIDAWAVQRGIIYKRAESDALRHEAAATQRLPAWIEFVLLFDVEYRRRRLSF